MRASANRVAAARGGWWRHAFRGGFFDFIYVIIEVIGTCMQNFKKIDLKKNSTFFNQSCSALFLLQTVLISLTPCTAVSSAKTPGAPVVRWTF